MDDISGRVGKLEGIVEIHNENVNRIFILLGEIKTEVDKNTVRAEQRDVALNEIANSVVAVDRKIETVNSKIENGLKTSIREIDVKVTGLGDCLDRRKLAREKAEQEGLDGFFKVGWKKFKAQGGFVVILLAIWFVIWMLGKTELFKESPVGLFKLFGIGG